eukprot:TRINITY_DN12306_c0_g1_i5.p1 TRINITY_DN12306_c0_g1~~TRINITY_DN12306_c0_g1_i5.p1  ORF type:complete len:314 (-),score=38.18 TRINITY_DN12306_c0_g1_i5:276-1217(-)
MAPKGRGRGRGKSTHGVKKEEENQASDQKNTLDISRAPTDNKQIEINSGLASSQVETDEPPLSIQQKMNISVFYPYLIIIVPVLLLLVGVSWMWSYMSHLEKEVRQLKNQTGLVIAGFRGVLDEVQQDQLNEIKLVINQMEQRQRLPIMEPSIKAAVVAHGDLAMDVLHGDNYRIANFILNGIGSWIGVHPLADDIVLRGAVLPDRCLPMQNEHAYIQVRLEKATLVRAIAIEQPSKYLLENYNSSPQEFEVLGGMEQEALIEIGKGKYQLHHQPYQMFTLAQKELENLKLTILSNYGHPNFTCLYKVKVFGS